MMNNIVEIFEKIYCRPMQVHCFAPGRVNLIGEHTDYNGGHVFPCAINLGIECVAAKRNDMKLRFYSTNFADAGVIEASLDALSYDGAWSDYPKSVIHTFRQFGYEIPYGADFVFSGNLPDGAGLSSSAALEVLTGLVLKELFNIPVTGQELAVFGQFAENHFIGVSCGIMDQFASAMGRAGCAILLDTNILDFEYAPVSDDDATLVIVNSNVKHSLASSAYNDRRHECEAALAALKNELKVSSLCALTPAQFEEHRHLIADDICRKRAKHAIYENARTIDAAKALKAGDLSRFGTLMNESHISLRDDYEVSCAELDFLAETAWNIKGVYGARITGGGFGGCTVNLVKNSCVETFMNKISAAYKERFNREAYVFAVKIADGAHRIKA